VYDSVGRRVSGIIPPPPTPIPLVAVLEENVEALLLATEPTRVVSEPTDEDDTCDGIKLSVALLVRLDLPLVRLNMCGILALLRDPAADPSGGWRDWYCSNSTNNAFRARRYSVAVCEFRSRIVGREKPRRR
jgi:hypothetical protein